MSKESIEASATHATLDDWIAREATPFSVDSPRTFNTAVDKLIASLGDSVELLGFGEALHGGKDILILRNRLFQRVVEAHGYSAIAIESSFPRAHVVNEYVAGRGPASYEAMQETGFTTASVNLRPIENSWNGCGNTTLIQRTASNSSSTASIVRPK
jgi:erythromycin esterase